MQESGVSHTGYEDEQQYVPQFTGYEPLHVPVRHTFVAPASSPPQCAFCMQMSPSAHGR